MGEGVTLDPEAEGVDSNAEPDGAAGPFEAVDGTFSVAGAFTRAGGSGPAALVHATRPTASPAARAPRWTPHRCVRSSSRQIARTERCVLLPRICTACPPSRTQNVWSSGGPIVRATALPPLDHPPLDRFGDVRFGDPVDAFETRDGSRDA